MKLLMPLLAALFCLSNVQGDTSVNRTFFETAGVRFGVGENRDSRVDGYEFFATSRSLTDWSLTRNLSASLHLEAGLGLLSHRSDDAFTARLGAVVDFSYCGWPVHFVLATNVAYLSDHTFGSLDLGSDFQFLSSAGFDWHLSDRWILGYRWQHISNGGITSVNPGLNLNAVSIGFRF